MMIDVLEEGLKFRFPQSWHQTIRRLRKDDNRKKNVLFVVFAVGCQSYYQRGLVDFKREVMFGIVLDYVRDLRFVVSRLDCQKLYKICLNRFKEKLPLGCDSFYYFLRKNYLILRIRRRKTRTTFFDSTTTFCPNLMKNWEVNRPKSGFCR